LLPSLLQKSRHTFYKLNAFFYNLDEYPLENVKSFKYFGSILTTDGIYNILVELNLGLLWQKMHLTRRGLFLQAKWTWN
jgi:hypothetical protein